MLTISKIMTVPVVLIQESATVENAIWLMRARRVRSLVVDKCKQDSPYGIVTDKDVVYKVTALELDPAKVSVSAIMRRPCIQLPPWLTVEEAAQTFSNAGIHRAPVVSESKLLGIVSITDILTKGSVVTPPKDEMSCRILESLRHAQILEDESAQIQQECDVAWQVYEDLRQGALTLSP